MASGDYVEIKGLPELLRKLNTPEWTSDPMGRFLDRWRFKVQRKTVANFKRGPKNGWIDTGLTRRSTASERDNGLYPEWARVGSNQKSFRWGDFGTGLLSEDPESAKRRYFPPYGAGSNIADWVRRRKPKDSEGNLLTPYEVARGIWRRGGHAPRRYLRNAVKATRKEIPHYLGLMAKEIEAEASK